MAWYKVGTVSVTNGQTSVNGTGTNWASNARVGDGFRGPDGEWYEIVNIASETTLGIYPAYAGTTEATGVYIIAPLQGYVKDSADRLRAVTVALEGAASDVSQARDDAQASAAAAATSETNAKASEIAAGASATTAGSSETNAATSAAAALASQTSANASQLASKTSETNAKNSETTAAASQVAAKTSETNAADSAAAALASQTQAAASATGAFVSETNAKASETAAKASETAAAASQADVTTKASDVTTKAAQVTADTATVAADKDLTKGYRDEAMQAATTVTGALVERGSVDLSSGIYPAVPPTPSFWKVVVAGTVDGIEYNVGDSLVYSKAMSAFYKIDSTEQVTSVNGKIGAVNITKTDVGLGNADNTSDVNKPVSTPQLAALNLKAPLASPSLTGTPTAPSAVASTSTTQIATTEFTQNAIDAKARTATVAAASVGGVLDLSGPTYNVALAVTVTVTENITQIILPAYTQNQNRRRELMIVFNNTGNFTVTGWPANTIYQTKAPAPIGKGAGVQTQVVLGNNGLSSAWQLYGNPLGYGQPLLRVPAANRLVCGATGGTALTTIANVLNTIRYVPLTVPRPITLSALGISITAVGTALSNMQIGIYDNDGDPVYDYPGTLLVSTAEGALVATTTGTKTAEVNYTLQPGKIYFAAYFSATTTPTVRGVPIAAVQTCLGFTDNSTTAITQYSEVTTEGKLPAKAATNGITNSFAVIPAIYLVEAL